MFVPLLHGGEVTWQLVLSQAMSQRHIACDVSRHDTLFICLRWSGRNSYNVASWNPGVGVTLCH